MEGPRVETATLGGGCFWCLEPVFEELGGVYEVAVGYAGGHVPDPTYERVCTGRTGHAEVVQVRFDPETVSFRRLLEVFFTIHDPTQVDRQGADVGPQYRSIVLYHSDEQRRTAEEVIRELEAELGEGSVATELTPFETFHRAEEEHQGYFRRHPERAYCRVVIRPKLARFRERFGEERKPGAA